MSDSLPHVTDTELAVLTILWDHDEQGSTVRQIVLELYGRHEHSLHGGVKSLLDRLIEKGYARVDKTGFAHRFFAAVTRERFVGHKLQQLAASHFGGSVAPMLLTLVDQVKLSKRDRATIQKIIDNIRE